MRRLVSAALLLLFSFALISPLLALGGTSETDLPACCRRDGKHHCALRASGRVMASERGRQASTPPDKCPYCPSFVARGRHIEASLASAESIRQALIVRRAVMARTSPLRRIALNFSRQQRGPPAASLL